MDSDGLRHNEEHPELLLCTDVFPEETQEIELLGSNDGINFNTIHTWNEPITQTESLKWDGNAYYRHIRVKKNSGTSLVAWKEIHCYGAPEVCVPATPEPPTLTPPTLIPAPLVAVPRTEVSVRCQEYRDRCALLEGRVTATVTIGSPLIDEGVLSAVALQDTMQWMADIAEQCTAVVGDAACNPPP